MKLKVTIVAIAAALCVFGFYVLQPEEKKTKEQAILEYVFASTKNYHYLDVKIDDSFSEKAYNQYLKTIDRSKRVLLASDVEQLSKYTRSIDDEINNGGALDFYNESYITEISRARTFGFMQEVEYLRSHGLARGGSLDNAIVLDEYKIINTDGLRYNDEFVRHKILDAVGDLYMLGYAIIGNFKAYKSGHELNNKLLLALLSDKKCWSLITLDSQDPKTSNLATRYTNSKNGILNQEMAGVYQ